ncbi:MAG: glycosyltransferase family 2 protein [Spirochaetota bacterium]|nr:glycosyltransferase family 2 protein [Spirochaetota bacterium]
MSSRAFSVVIPVYNKRPHIERAVRSVLKQTHQDFELILIDDASTDGSMDEIARIEDPRIVTARRDTPGPGGYAARNLGTGMARNEWVAFLDADDEWNDGILAEFTSLMEKFPEARVLCTGFVYKRGDREVVNGFTTRQPGASPRTVDLQEYLRETRKGRCPIHTSCVCIRRDLLQEIGGFPEGKCRRGGDRDTWLRAAGRSLIAWSPYIGELYYCDSVNMVTKTVPEGEGCSLQTIEWMIDTYSGAAESRALLLELKRLQNNLLEIRIRKKAKDGRLHVSDLKGYSFTVSPISWLGYLLLALLPDAAIRMLLAVFFSIKKLIRGRNG